MRQLDPYFTLEFPLFKIFVEIGGTLNVEIDSEYPKKDIRGEGVIRFESDKIPPMKNQAGRPYPREGYTFIPIYKIQDEIVCAYIYSPDGTCNPDNVIEIMADFKIRDKYNLNNGDTITFEVYVPDSNNR